MQIHKNLAQSDSPLGGGTHTPISHNIKPSKKTETVSQSCSDEQLWPAEGWSEWFWVGAADPSGPVGLWVWGGGVAPEDEACSGGRSHWNLGVWALFQVLHAVPEQYLWWLLGGDAGKWGRCACMVGVCKKQTNKPKKQRFPGRAWMMNATHVTWEWFKCTKSC